MQHHHQQRTLSRTRRGRTALLRGLASSLIAHGRIVTTHAKAKELRPFVERLVTSAKNDTVAARRTVAMRLGEPARSTVQKLFVDIAPRYSGRAGGYTRIVKVGTTLAGRTEAVIEFV